MTWFKKIKLFFILLKTPKYRMLPRQIMEIKASYDKGNADGEYTWDEIKNTVNEVMDVLDIIIPGSKKLFDLFIEKNKK